MSPDIGEGEWPADEYDAYLGPCLSLLDQGSSKGELAGYLSRIIGDHMGLGEVGIAYSKPEEFADELCSWHESYQEGGA